MRHTNPQKHWITCRGSRSLLGAMAMLLTPPTANSNNFNPESPPIPGRLAQDGKWVLTSRSCISLRMSYSRCLPVLAGTRNAAAAWLYLYRYGKRVAHACVFEPRTMPLLTVLYLARLDPRNILSTISVHRRVPNVSSRIHVGSGLYVQPVLSWHVPHSTHITTLWFLEHSHPSHPRPRRLLSPSR